MKTIYRYAVRPDRGLQTVAVHVGSRPIHIGPSREGLSIWVEQGTSKDLDFDMPFMVVGTGWSIPDGWEYVGTDCGATGWVWHLYRRAPDAETAEGDG